MASYAVTSVITDPGDLDTVVTAMETAIEDTDSGSTIHYWDVIPVGTGFRGVIVHED